MSYYKDQLNQWLSELKVKADSVLDIGGSQSPTKGRTKTWEVKEYFIADLPDPHREAQAPDYRLNMNHKYSWPELNNRFDLIFCFEVFDYIWNPFAAMSNIDDWLKPGGSAWVSFPFVYPIHNPVEFDGLRYTEPGIRQLADGCGLKVAEVIYRRPGNSHLVQFYAEDGMRAAKGYDHNITGYIVRLKK